MTNSQDSEEEKAAERWVETNMSWDDYEAQWVESGVKTFLAGIEWERKRKKAQPTRRGESDRRKVHNQ
ncbi:MAG: hypothetical protein BWY21_00333 [Parcubacteria group bacterium ADurb.Bin216]|nr:MAG: hypothetical protein BWY21_00333 [Parcubacteria group bacterium ADurb.Bin216]